MLEPPTPPIPERQLPFLVAMRRKVPAAAWLDARQQTARCEKVPHAPAPAIRAWRRLRNVLLGFHFSRVAYVL